jgi:predicted PurR-regulated permease PerM
MSLNPIVVFISLAFWGWMWGVGGALLAVPILAITKVTCDQFERTQPLGTLLGGGLQA